MTGLEIFAFNQARFVFVTMRTIERNMCQHGTSESESFRLIKQSKLGSKYLQTVTLAEVQREGKQPGFFMNLNTQLGSYVPDDDWDAYVETFIEYDLPIKRTNWTNEEVMSVLKDCTSIEEAMNAFEDFNRPEKEPGAMGMLPSGTIVHVGTQLPR